MIGFNIYTIKNKYVHYLFIFLLILSIQISSDLIIDNLIFRGILVAIITSAWIIVLLLFYKNIKIQYDELLLFSLLYIALYSVSIFWSTTYTLSVVGISKLFLFFILFIVLNISLKQNDDILTILIKAIILSFLLSFYSFFKQLLLLDNFVYSSLYSLTGICGHKNLFSSYIFLTLIGSLIGLQYLQKQKFWFVLVICTLILQLVTIIILRTRAVWLACTISILVFTVLSFFNKINIKPSRIWFYSILISIVTTFLFVFLLPYVIKGYLTKQPESTDITKIADIGTLQERIKIWDKTYELINDNIYWGVGSGNWKVEISKYSLPDIYKVQDLNVIFQRPHNEYLKILSENGIIGLFFFLVLLNYFNLSLFNPNNTLTFKSTKLIFSGFIGFNVIMFFSFPLERIEHIVILTFLLSIVYFSTKNYPKQHRLDLLKKLLIIPLVICVVIIVIFQSRYKSSYYLKKMYFERNINNNEKVLSLCDSAITIFTKIDDFSIPIHWYRGNANTHNFKAALQDFKCAQKYHPYNPNVLNDLGSAYVMNNNVDSAIYFYEIAAKINPRFDDPKLNLVALYLNVADLEKAKKWEGEILHDSERRTNYKIIINQMENNKLSE